MPVGVELPVVFTDARLGLIVLLLSDEVDTGALRLLEKGVASRKSSPCDLLERDGVVCKTLSARAVARRFTAVGLDVTRSDLLTVLAVAEDLPELLTGIVDEAFFVLVGRMDDNCDRTAYFDWVRDDFERGSSIRDVVKCVRVDAVNRGESPTGMLRAAPS